MAQRQHPHLPVSIDTWMFALIRIFVGKELIESYTLQHSYMLDMNHRDP